MLGVAPCLWVVEGIALLTFLFSLYCPTTSLISRAVAGYRPAPGGIALACARRKRLPCTRTLED